jgi:hypothetical protein
MPASTPARSSIKSRRLVIIPTADLYQIPFEVLQNPEDGRFLYEEFELSYAPSATILLGMKPPRSPKDGRLLAVADPDLKAEVEAVATLYPGRTTTLAGPVPATKAEVTRGSVSTTSSTSPCMASSTAGSRSSLT